MTERILYDFEELSEDLPRPPLVAVRALLMAGLLPSPRGWSNLPPETRRAIAIHGLQGLVDVAAVRELAQQISPRHLKLVSRSRDPNPDTVPLEVSRALGPARPISDAEWRSLRAVDRAILASLIANTRLLSRAYDELCERMGKSPPGAHTLWKGAIAHCELHTREDALERILSPSFLEGRALTLARVAGIRCARRIHEIFDLHAESATGPVELNASVRFPEGIVIWQAHVSTWDGAFFPAAALFATTTAATALFDMLKEEDPHASLTVASIREEAWIPAMGGEEATKVYSMGSMGVGTEKRGTGDSGASPQREEEPQVGPQTELQRLPSSYTEDASGSHHAPTSRSSPASPSIQSSSMEIKEEAKEEIKEANVARNAPVGLIVLFVASLVILVMALGIFGYVIAVSL